MNQSAAARPIRLLRPIVVAALVSILTAGHGIAAAPAWSGNGDPNASGTWSTGANWSLGAAPVANDDVTLGDVTISRTVNYDTAGTILTLNSLTLSQLTSGSVGTPILNQLTYTSTTAPKTLTVVNGIVLGTSASNATVELTLIGPPNGGGSTSNTPLLAALGGLTVNAGGILNLQSGVWASGGTSQTFLALTGNATVAGGTVDFSAPTTGSGTATDGINIGSFATGNPNLAGSDTFSMSSGLMRIHATTWTGGGDGERIQMNSNFNWTGGTMQFVVDSGTAASTSTFTLHGLTNAIGAGAVFQNVTAAGVATNTPLNLTMSIAGGNPVGAQALTQTLSLGTGVGTITMREFDSTTTNTYTHLISSTAPATAISQVVLTSSGAADVFQLGSDLTATTTGEAVSATANGGAALVNSIIDLNGHTFTGMGRADWTPNKITNVATAATAWQVISSTPGGVYQAKTFNLSLSGAAATDSFILGAHTTLEAMGGAGTVNTLSAGLATYTFDPTSTFRYSGGAAAANAAKLVSSSAIGSLDVKTGALQLNQAAFNTLGGVTVESGGNLQLIGTMTLASNQSFVLSGGTLMLGAVGDYIFGSGTGTFSLAGTLNLIGFSSAGTYQILSGFESGSVAGLAITGLTGGLTGVLDDTGLLTIAPVPEPALSWLLIAGAAALGMHRLRRRAVTAS